jgi:hypothetical protein
MHTNLALNFINSYKGDEMHSLTLNHGTRFLTIEKEFKKNHYFGC